MTLIANHPTGQSGRIWIAAVSAVRFAAVLTVLVLLALVATASAQYFNSYPELDAAQMLIGP
ncbi:MAG: hypothetical protein ACRECC_00940 [Pseudolabrys sp.]